MLLDQNADHRPADAEIAEQANGATRSREPVGGRQLGDTRLLLRGMAFDQAGHERAFVYQQHTLGWLKAFQAPACSGVLQKALRSHQRRREVLVGEVGVRHRQDTIRAVEAPVESGHDCTSRSCWVQFQAARISPVRKWQPTTRAPRPSSAAQRNSRRRRSRFTRAPRSRRRGRNGWCSARSRRPTNRARP